MGVVGLIRSPGGMDRQTAKGLVLVMVLALLLQARLPKETIRSTSIWGPASPSFSSSSLSPSLLSFLAIRAAAFTPYRDSEGTLFAPDSSFSASDTTTYDHPIDNTPDPPLFESERWARELNYTLTGVANGMWTVDLYETESFLSDPGQRVFDVLVQGQVRLQSVDIVAAAGGPFRALVLSIPDILVLDHTLSISFVGRKDMAKVCAIKAERLDPLPAELREHGAGQEASSATIAGVLPITFLFTLGFTILMGPMAEALGYRTAIVSGATVSAILQALLSFGVKSALAAQIVYGLSPALDLALLSLSLLLTPERHFQLATSLVMAAMSIGALATTKILRMAATSSDSSLLVQFTPLALAVIAVPLSLALPRDPERSPANGIGGGGVHEKIRALVGDESLLRELALTYTSKALCVLSFWWIFSLSSIGLLHSLTPSLIDYLDEGGPLNPSILRAVLLASALGSLLAIPLAGRAAQSGSRVYILGSLTIAAAAMTAGLISRVLVAYTAVVVLAIPAGLLGALVVGQLALLVKNGRYALLVTTNAGLALLVQAGLQVGMVRSHLSATRSFIILSLALLIATALFLLIAWVHRLATGRIPLVVLPDRVTGYSLVTGSSTLRRDSSFTSPLSQPGSNWDDAWTADGYDSGGEGLQLAGRLHQRAMASPIARKSEGHPFK